MGILDTFNLAKKSKSQLKNLNQLNKLAAAVLAFQAIIILILANGSTGSRSISNSFLTADPQTTDASGQAVLAPAVHHLFDFNLAYLVAAFLLIAAIIRLLVAFSSKSFYERELKKGYSRFRWLEYALSGGLMVVTIAVLVGVLDFSTLFLIFVANGVAALVGLLAEEGAFSTKYFGWVAKVGGPRPGFAPWVVIAIFLWGAHAYGAGLPAYSYWLAGSVFLLAVAWVKLNYFSYVKRGRWADYLKVEQAYIILSLLTTAALAWQVYAGALRV